MQNESSNNRPSLAGDLATLAGRERSRLGEPPTAEQLLAYRDGTLSAEDADRIADWLAVDPRWADVYLELDASAENVADPRGESTPEVDAAWQRFEATLESDETTHVERPVASGGRFPWHSTNTFRNVWGIAALLTVAVGLGWWWVGPSSPLLTGSTLLVTVDGTVTRGAEDLRFDPEHTSVTFRVPHGRLAEVVPDLAQGGIIELRDSSEVSIARRGFDAVETAVDLDLEVPVAALHRGRTYRLVIGPKLGSVEVSWMEAIYELDLDD